MAGLHSDQSSRAAHVCCLAPQARAAQSPAQYEEDDLPAVDDMEIAARAAAGVRDPVGPILRKACSSSSYSACSSR